MIDTKEYFQHHEPIVLKGGFHVKQIKRKAKRIIEKAIEHRLAQNKKNGQQEWDNRKARKMKKQMNQGKKEESK